MQYFWIFASPPLYSWQLAEIHVTIPTIRIRTQLMYSYQHIHLISFVPDRNIIIWILISNGKSVSASVLQRPHIISCISVYFAFQQRGDNKINIFAVCHKFALNNYINKQKHTQYKLNKLKAVFALSSYS